jgi:hypothetical protein
MSSQARDLLRSAHACIVNVSKQHSALVIGGLVKVLKVVNSSVGDDQHDTTYLGVSAIDI